MTTPLWQATEPAAQAEDRRRDDLLREPAPAPAKRSGAPHRALPPERRARDPQEPPARRPRSRSLPLPVLGHRRTHRPAGRTLWHSYNGPGRHETAYAERQPRFELDCLARLRQPTNTAWQARSVLAIAPPRALQAETLVAAETPDRTHRNPRPFSSTYAVPYKPTGQATARPTVWKPQPVSRPRDHRLGLPPRRRPSGPIPLPYRAM